jgi:hypothetical protein
MGFALLNSSQRALEDLTASYCFGFQALVRLAAANNSFSSFR